MFGYEGSYFWGDVGIKFFLKLVGMLCFGGCNDGLTEGFLVCSIGGGGWEGGEYFLCFFSETSPVSGAEIK